ncbi:MAG TPA: MraY family glycosyltransferase [Chitinophagaceae bacterium]|nr:MraY family glycosyltransferase [Chitinophagaceae bacterium]
MKSHFHLLQIDLHLHDYKSVLSGFFTAFAVTLIIIPPVILFFKRTGIFDMPGNRKLHSSPIPTMGGITIIAGMVMASILWFPFSNDATWVCIFFSIAILAGLGIMDDLKDLSARYKFMVQFALAAMIALSGLRITSFNGLFGVHHLPVTAQYIFTIIVITGITNAFNLIDGIDGLAAGMSFMSLITLGIFLNICNDSQSSFIAFALAGAVLAFLFFNTNPAKIFMGDTGSLVLGFVIAVLCTRLMQLNSGIVNPVLKHASVFTLGIVLIPVFDTLRVFALRIWRGKSPFAADKTHIHHLLTNTGISHSLTTRLICSLHGLILVEVYWLQKMKEEIVVAALLVLMIVITLLFRNISVIYPVKNSFLSGLLKKKSNSFSDTEYNDPLL